MNKAELIKEIAKDQNITLKDAEKTVNVVLNTIEKGIIDGEKISIRDFGVWDTYESKATRRKIPNSEEIIEIPSQTRVRFKAGAKLQNTINESED